MNLIFYIIIILFFSCGNNSKDNSPTSRISDTKKITPQNDTIIIFESGDNSIYRKGIFISSEKDSLLFRILIPNINDTNKYEPVVLFFHGAGERGNDNEKQLIHGSKLFDNALVREKYESFVLFPQCPEDSRWVDVDWTLDNHIMPETPTIQLNLSIQLLNRLIKSYKIDTNRLYVMGLSMGGFGTWDMICRYPEKFAAAIPICGGGDENQVSKIKDIPVWAFHGKKDKIVKVSRSRNMINAIKNEGGNPKYTEYENTAHNAWDKAFQEPGLLEWLFIQKKSN